MVKVVITVKKDCPWGYHKEGDRFEVEGDLMPGGICIGALFATLPVLLGLQHGAQYAWAKDKDKLLIHCPDPGGMTIELKRMKKEGLEGCMHSK